MRSVASLIDDGPLEIERAVRITIAACHAYARAKPSHVVTPDRILVADNGDAALLRPSFRFPDVRSWLRLVRLRIRILRGRMRKRTPKIIVVRNEILWEPMNVFALGAMLWELLAGRRVGIEVLPLPAAVPTELEAILRKALASKLDERYRTPVDLANALAAYLAR